MKYITLLSILFLMVGCLSSENISKPPVRLKIPQVSEGLSHSVHNLDVLIHKTKASVTENEILANEIEKTSENETIKRYSIKIAGNSNQQISNMDSASTHLNYLMEHNYQLNLIQRYLKDVNKQYSIILDQNKELRKQQIEMKRMLSDISLQTDKNFAIIMNVLMAIGGGLFVVGIIMLAWGLYSGSGLVKTGMLFGGVGIGILSTAYFMGSNPLAVLIIGGTCVIGLIFYLVILLYRHRNALEETVESMEIVKKHGWNDAKEKIKHSNFTKQIVNEAKIKKDILEKKIKRVIKE